MRGVLLGIIHAQAAAGGVPGRPQRFDFAAVTYMQKLGFDLDRRLPELFPRGEVALALELADVLLPLPMLR